MTENPKPASRRKIFAIAAAVAALAIAVGVWSSNRAPRVSYRESPVRRGDIVTSILTTGTVQPENRLEIKSPVAGRVERVLVKEGQKVQKGQILAWMSSTERAALLDVARAQGAEEVKKWEELYRPTPVVAPIRGTVITRNVESGQTFTTTDAILVMSDRLTVKAQVDETDIAQVKLKQHATIVLDAYAGQKVSAIVDQIAFEAKTVNNVTTYLVDVLPVQTPEFMRAGMTANVTFEVESKEDVLVVPAEAISAKDGATKVLVRSTSGTAVEREIKTGLSDGKRTEVVEGLVESDIVLSAQVTSGTRAKPSLNPFSPSSGRGGGRGH